MKPKWGKKPCGCVKVNFIDGRRAMVRCTKHRGKPSKRELCYFDADGIVRKEAA